MTDELDIPWDPSISSVFSKNDALLFTICILIEHHLLQSTYHEDQLHLHHHGLDVMYQCRCHDHHLGPI